MIKQLLAFYKLLDANKNLFEKYGLEPIAFMDIYRTQPLYPELYEYFDMPAIFIDYTMQGNGIKQARTITMALHIVIDELPDASNIAQQKEVGLSQFTYNLLLQQILEGSKLDQTTSLKFLSEEPIDSPVVNYHTQSYQFESYLADMLENDNSIFGEFERLNIFGGLKK